MTLHRAERFDIDIQRQFRWYLLETGLDPVDGLALGTRFIDAVEATLDMLRANPGLGRRRFVAFPDLVGMRSWRVRNPFKRFLVFYRVQGDNLFAERLLEAHRRLVAGP
jgi:hypothetical protein